MKDIEKVTNHDVKAVEYFIKEEFDKIGGLDAFKEFIHFGLTSQDINNTSVPLSIKEALEEGVLSYGGGAYRSAPAVCRRMEGRAYARKDTRSARIAHTPRQGDHGIRIPSHTAA